MINERMFIFESGNGKKMLIPLEDAFLRNRQDSRRFVRKECKSKLICESYNPEKDIFEKIDAVVYNSSKGGLFFGANRSFFPGFPIYVRSNDPFIIADNQELACGIHSKIIWCDEMESRTKNHIYFTGIEFF